MKNAIFFPTLVLAGVNMAAAQKPNILIIQTDEQTIRSIGTYRDLMEPEASHPWGANIQVNTPNIDRIAREGVVCTNYYATCPVSTPSRASLQTGLYPVATGAPINDMQMDQRLDGFADKLQDAGYYTSYLGKWHLAAVPAIGRPYFQPGHDFGWENRTYMFEGGHWKYYNVVGRKDQLTAGMKPAKDGSSIFATDYLVDRTLEVLEESKDTTFCVMLSIPDPHSPDITREPYASKYVELTKDAIAPATMVTAENDNRPAWASGQFKNTYKEDFDRKALGNYFAAVKCIDDNIGRILDWLDENDLDENTIVIFTSDHGDMLYEHSRTDKGVPYDASARIPFVMRYPKGVKAGKVINTCYTTADFAPTLLGMVGAEPLENIHGTDDSKAFLSRKKKVNSSRIIYATASPISRWTMATDGRYKLVLSPIDTPWLFDMKKDPSETHNYFSDPAYKEIAEELKTELLRQMKEYKEPGLAYGFNYLLDANDTPDPKLNMPDSPTTEELAPVINRMVKECIRPLK